MRKDLTCRALRLLSSKWNLKAAASSWGLALAGLGLSQALGSAKDKKYKLKSLDGVYSDGLLGTKTEIPDNSGKFWSKRMIWESNCYAMQRYCCVR
jgi:hypothetical protein